jgi:hypothetical protein
MFVFVLSAKRQKKSTRPLIDACFGTSSSPSIEVKIFPAALTDCTCGHSK